MRHIPFCTEMFSSERFWPVRRPTRLACAASCPLVAVFFSRRFLDTEVGNSDRSPAKSSRWLYDLDSEKQLYWSQDVRNNWEQNEMFSILEKNQKNITQPFILGSINTNYNYSMTWY